MSHSLNIHRIKAVNQALGELRNKVVYVGGATVSLYADRQTLEVRETQDVDILIELLTHKEYAAIEKQLRKIGFENDIESGVICRFKMQGLIVDVMPTGENVFGFSNKCIQMVSQMLYPTLLTRNIRLKYSVLPTSSLLNWKHLKVGERTNKVCLMAE